MSLNADAILLEIKDSYLYCDESNKHQSTYKYLAVKNLIEDTDYDFDGVSINYIFHGIIEMAKASSCECFAIAEPRHKGESATYVDATDKPCEGIRASIASLGWR